jgi:hypothetical protein
MILREVQSACYDVEEMHLPIWAIMEKLLVGMVNTQCMRSQWGLTCRITSQGKSLMDGTVLRVLRWRTSTAAF